MDGSKITYILNNDNSLQYIPYIIGNISKFMNKLLYLKLNDIDIYLFCKERIAFTYNKIQCNNSPISLISFIGEPFTKINNEIFSNSYLCLKLLENNFVILSNINLYNNASFNNNDNIPDVFILFVLDNLSNTNETNKILNSYPSVLIEVDTIICNLWSRYNDIVYIPVEYRRLIALYKICLLYGEYSRLANNINIFPGIC